MGPWPPSRVKGPERDAVGETVVQRQKQKAGGRRQEAGGVSGPGGWSSGQARGSSFGREERVEESRVGPGAEG